MFFLRRQDNIKVETLQQTLLKKNGSFRMFRKGFDSIIKVTIDSTTRPRQQHNKHNKVYLKRMEI